jgi:hypothetical protein
MNNLRICLTWISTFSLVGASLGLEGCGSKDKEPVPVVQQSSPDAAAATPVANQQADPQQQQQTANQQQAATQQQPIQLPDVNLTPEGLDELLAPIALYPDPVLAVMLQASVDPQQVMDGGNWLTMDQNQNLKEAALDQASSKAGFTPVMQALLHYPSVVDMMCTQFDWTKQLGAAYSADPKSVLGSVQRLRAIAVDNGALKTSDQMKVDVKKDQGQEVVQIAPANPKVVYVPQYDPQQVFSTTTTTTNPDGSTTTTTTTSGPAPTTSTNTTVVVQQQPQQQSSGVSTGSAVMIGLLSFGAGIAVGAAINNNNYYYPAWGYGGVYYGGRPYYPPPYYPHYHGGWGPSYGYNRPVHYGNNNIYINNNHYNNNYYNRFNNNSNLNSNYKPMPVHYNNKPNGVYANSMGNRPGSNQGVKYNRPNNGNNYQGNAQTRPANQPNRPAGGNNNNGQVGSNVAQRPGNNAQPGNTVAPRPGNTAGGTNNNWKGQSTYQGNKTGGANGQTRPGSVNTGAPNTRPGGVNAGGPSGNNKFGNANVDRGYGQQSGGRQNTGAPATRPSTGNTPAARPATGNAPASRPAPNNQTRPAPTQTASPRPQQQSKPSAFGGSSNPSADHSASDRGRASMGAPQHTGGGASRQAAPKNVKR